MKKKKNKFCINNNLYILPVLAKVLAKRDSALNQRFGMVDHTLMPVVPQLAVAARHFQELVGLNFQIAAHSVFHKHWPVH